MFIHSERTPHHQDAGHAGPRSSCGAEPQVEDGRDLCPACRIVGHVREALPDPCNNCAVLPVKVREVRLARVEGLFFTHNLPASAVIRQDPPRAIKRGKVYQTDGAKIRASLGKVESLSSDIEQLKILSFQPHESGPSSAGDATENSDSQYDDLLVTKKDVGFRPVLDFSYVVDGQRPPDRSSRGMVHITRTHPGPPKEGKPTKLMATPR